MLLHNQFLRAAHIGAVRDLFQLCMVTLASLVTVNVFAAPENAEEVRPGTIIYKVSETARAGDLRALNALLKSEGLVRERTLEGTQIVIATFDHPGREKAIANILKRSSYVEFAEPDYEVAPTIEPSDPDFGTQWHHSTLNSRQAWEITTGGSDVLVGVCDTGFDVTHPDLAWNLRTDLAFNAQDGSTYIFDANGHGTGTAGTLGAVGNNATGVAGANWSVGIIPVRIAISDSNASAYISTMATCIEYAADQGARIVNLSYGGIQYSTIDAAASYLRSRGGLLFMSAGNSGAEFASYPDYTSFIGVGATDQNNDRANFSNWGKFVDVVAPGVSIRTTYPNNRYVNYSGTSFSAPLTAGIAALMVAANPSISVEQIENGLFSTATDIGSNGDDDVFGHGLVNAQAAVNYSINLGSVMAPVADIAASDNVIPFGDSVFLSAQSSSDADGSIVEYLWDLGDGTTSDQVDVTHNFAATGTYQVSLTVTDNDRLTDSQTINIQVTNERPVAAIDGMVTSYNLGDTVYFSATGSYDTDGEIVSFAWEFGDGQSASGIAPEHTYTTGGDFVARLTVTDNAGAMDSVAQNISVIDSTGNTAPTASFSVDCSDLDCSFDGRASTDAEGDVASYRWEFGDGNSGDGQTASHTYPTEGTYTATLTVIDSYGATDATSREVTVTSGSSSDIILITSGYKVRGTKYVDLVWSNAMGTNVEIHRTQKKGSRIFTTTNDGAYQDSFSGGGSFVYKICEIGGEICSAEQGVDF